MIMIRQQYLKRLIEFRDTEFIKVLTGVRRSGKSYILNMFREYLINRGVEQHRVIYINFEHPDANEIRNYIALNEHLGSLVDKYGKNILSIRRDPRS